MSNLIKVGELLVNQWGSTDDLINILLANQYVLTIEHVDGKCHILIYAKEGKELCMDL